MLKIAAVLFVSTVFAKLDNPTDDYIFHEWFNNLEEYNISPKFKKLSSVDAWVLSLNRDVDSLKLRRASGEEVREVFGAQLDDSPTPRQPRKNKDTKKSSARKLDDKTMLSEIMRVINKFALSSQDEPQVNLEENGENTTIKLYFKGALTSLVVRAEGRQWHYIIRPPSLFPDWFYEPHEPVRDASGPHVDVPKNITGEFYNALFHMLTLFLSFPV